MKDQAKTNSQLLKEIEVLKAENVDLKKNKEIFQIIAENAVDNIAITTFDLKAKYIYVSPSTKATLGYEPHELIDKSFFDFIHPSDKKVLLLLVKKYIAKTVKSILKIGDPNVSETIEFRFKNKEGDWRIMESSVNFLGKNLLAITRDITEKRRMISELYNSEVRFKSIFSEAPIAIEYYDAIGNLVDANKECLKIFGIEDINAIKGFKLFEDPNLSEKSKTQVKQGNPFQYETEFDFELVKKHQLYNTTKSGKSFLNILITPFENKEINKKEYLVHILDITNRKKAEKEIQLSEEKYRIFFENNDAIILFINPNNRDIIFSNQAASNFYGYSKKQLSKMKISDIVVLSEEEIRTKMAGARKKKQNLFLLKHKLASGEIRDVEVYQTKLNLNNKEIFSIIVHDITDRSKVQQELLTAKERIEISEKKFRELFEKSGDPFLIIENGKFIDCNDATVKLLKYKNKEEMLNFHPSKLSPPFQSDGRDSVEKANELIENVLKKGTLRFEWDHKKSTGEIFPVEVLLTAITNEPNKKVIHTVWRDITKRKKTEKNLKAALKKAKESDRLKSAFLANMSHEIRTPMNGILGFANLLKEQELSGDEQEKYIGIIEKSGERMLNIINDLIDIAKVESGQMDIALSKTNINKQIEYAYTFFRPEVENKGMKFSFKTPLKSEDATIYTDKEKFFAILTNLVKNAIKYSEHGRIKIGYEKKNNFFEFYVKDSGSGIPKNMHIPIFDRFIQTKSAEKKAIQGAGLGLSISKAYVEMLGGKIWVESKLNEGSTFYFTIPVKTKNEKVDDSSDNLISIETKNKLKKLKILIAEDEDIAILLLKTILKDIQKEIIVVKTGTDAVNTYIQNPDIDLILMDIGMPKMNGYEATRKIREIDKDVIIIAQTAYAIQGDNEKVIESGCNAYVSKPIHKPTLLEIIKQHFE